MGATTAAVQPSSPPRDPTAVVGRRILAVIIDTILITVPTILLVTREFEYFTRDTWNQQFPGTPIADACDRIGEQYSACLSLGDSVYVAQDPSQMPALLGLGLSLILYVVLQGLTGFTPGKAITGIRTVAEDGSTPGLGRAAVRWLLLIVDWMPCGLPLVGFITALSSKGHRRVGDMAAKTFVVRKEAAGEAITVPGVTTGAAVGGYGQPAYAGVQQQPPQQHGGWGPAPPEAAGWGSPSGGPPQYESGPPQYDPEPAASAPSTAEPQWDEARGTYIQWDEDSRKWLQWDDQSKSWSPIPGQ